MMKTKILIMLMTLLPMALFAQRDQEVIKKQIAVSNVNTEYWFCACNINGDISVEAYDGKTIEVEATKQVWARDQAEIDRGMKELDLIVSEEADYSKIIMKSPNHDLTEKDDPLECGWNWRRDSRRPDYRYRVDYKIKVPKGISVKVSTVNDGHVWVENVEGNIYASNVNGDVNLEGVNGNTKASTVNGTVEVEYTKMPTEFASFKTVNGNIEVYTVGNADGVYNFETQWGKVFSDLEFDEKVAPKMTKTKKGRGTMYKIANSNGYKVGNGGPEFHFETLNGNIRIRKQK